ncbi:MAG: mannose-1-phosphate guanylyltransferase [Clostridium sp.]|jgi:mannose-1-phosphate guanylyltransferase
MVSVVIMAGGRGERFWPRSRKKLPKQLLSLTGDGKTMIQITVERIKSLVEYKNIYIVTNEEFSDIISYQLPNVPTENILIEPVAKNTAPCIGLAAIHIAKKNPESVMVILPSDHIIEDKQEFISILNSGIEMANNEGNIITIGITPGHAETGYGYIKLGDKHSVTKNNSIFKVDKFVEKPNFEKAEQYLASGDYLWNSGMFVCTASTMLNSMNKHMPELYIGLMKIKDAMDEDNEEEIFLKEFNKFQSISIDYGIMEQADKVYTIPGDFGWDDVGSWNSLERISGTDVDGNTVMGNIISIDTKGCIIQGNGKLIATIGVENLVVVDTVDATLICAKDKCQDIKKILKEMRNSNNECCL